MSTEQENEITALKVQLSEEIQKQKNSQNHFQQQSKDLEKTIQFYQSQQAQRDILEKEINEKKIELEKMNQVIVEKQKKQDELFENIKKQEENLLRKRTAAESYGPADSGPSEKSMQGQINYLEEQVRKLEAQNQNAKRESQKRQDELTDKNNSEIAQLKLSNQELVSANQQLQQQIDDLKIKLEQVPQEANKDDGGLQEALEQEQKKNADLTKQIQELNDQLKKISETQNVQNKEELDFEEKLNQALKKQEDQLQSKHQESINSLQKQLRNFELQVTDKAQELLKYEENLLKLTQELSVMKDQLQDSEDNNQIKSQKLQDLTIEMQELQEQYDLNKKDLYDQLDQKDQSLSETFAQLNEANKQLHGKNGAVQEAETAIREYRAKIRKMEEEVIAYKKRYDQNEIELQQMKEDMQQLVNDRDELERIFQEQSKNVKETQKNIFKLEEQVRQKQLDIEKLDQALNLSQQSEAEIKKVLIKVDLKNKQITNFTLKDLKKQLKQSKSEIEVLKEMVRASSIQLKTKDIDIQKLNKRNQRLEKLIEVQKGIEGLTPQKFLPNIGSQVIQESDENLEETNQYNLQQFNSKNRFSSDFVDYGNGRMAPLSVGSKPNGGKKARSISKNVYQYPQNDYNPAVNFQIKEFEEANMLDQILEEERRNQSLQAFANHSDQKYDKYLASLDIPNIKNASRGVAGIFGMGDTGGQYENQQLINFGKSVNSKSSYFPNLV